MSWTDGIDDGGWGEFGGGYAGSPVDASVSGFGADLGGSYGGGVSLSGPVGPSNQSSENLGYDISSTDYAVPTGNFKSGVNITQQVKDNNIYANALKSVMAAMVPGLGMVRGAASLLGQVVGNTRNSNFANRAMLDAGLRAQYTDPNTYDFDNLTTTFTGPETERQGLISAKMSGFGARKGIATGIDPRTGLHVGPGYPMSEDFFPGYGVNPYTGDAMADPGDPYIRKKRGTEIVGMVGP